MHNHQENVRIAIDLGASSGRVIAGIIEDGSLRLHEIHRFENPAIELPSGLHWNLLGLFHEIVTGLKTAVSSYGERIASIGIDTWACDFGLFDQQGELLGAPHQYRDPRHEGMAEKMHALIPEAAIYSRTGIKTNFYNSSLHLLAAQSANSPALLHASSLLLVPDILAYWLTGRLAVERTNASTTQLVDPLTGDWAWDVIEILGLPKHLFGKIVAPGTILGELRPELAAIIGRSDIPFVVAACHDTASAVAGIPLVAPETLWLSSGTWSIMGVETATPITTPQALGYGFCNELGIDGTVRFLKNIGGLWLIQECKRHWDLQGEKLGFGELAELAAAADAFTSFIDPDSPDFASPGDMPAKIRKFCAATGQAVPETPGQILRVVTESLALKYRVVFERIKELTGRDYARLNAGGGGIQNQPLCQATADALGIEVLAGPIEATSCGNLITQMIATGELPDYPTARQLVRESFPFKTYTPNNTAAWDAAYLRFQKFLVG